MRMAGVKGPRPCLRLLGKGDWPRVQHALVHLHKHTHTRTHTWGDHPRTLENGPLLPRPVFSQPCSHSRRFARPLTLSPRPPRVHVYARAHTCLSGILARQAIFSLNDLMDSFHSYKAPESMESERERIDPEEIPAVQETRSQKHRSWRRNILWCFKIPRLWSSTRGCSVWGLFL